jgi:putative NADH-flavin reductase
MKNDIRIAVIGGTGKAGSYLLKELIKRNYRIRALARTPEKLRDISAEIEIIPGNIQDYNTVHSLISGCDAVISTLGQSKGEELVFSIAAGNIIKAMNLLQVKRYVVVTGITLDIPGDKKGLRTKIRTDMMKMLFGSILKDKQNEYKILSESNLEWTIVRVPFIELTETVSRIETCHTDCKGNKISAADLASFIADQISDRRYNNMAPFIWSAPA